MEVRIGVRDVARELVFESDQSADELSHAVAAALKAGGTLTLADDKGGQYVLPVSALGYVHIGTTEKGRVGFGAL